MIEFRLKGIVHPKMKISQLFTHPQGILCMSDIPLSDKHIRSYIPHCPVQERSQKGDSGCASEKLGVPHLLSD